MSAITVANTQAKLANANAAEAMLNQAYSFAGKAGMSGEMRNAFMALADMLADHRSAAQESASAALVELRAEVKPLETPTGEAERDLVWRQARADHVWLPKTMTEKRNRQHLWQYVWSSDYCRARLSLAHDEALAIEDDKRRKLHEKRAQAFNLMTEYQIDCVIDRDHEEALVMNGEMDKRDLTSA